MKDRTGILCVIVLKIMILIKWKVFFEIFSSMIRQSSSLLANSCKSSLLLVNHSTELQTNVWNFGKHIDTAHKIWLELNEFKKCHDITAPNTLLNAVYLDDLGLAVPDFRNKSEIVQNSYDKCVKLFDKHCDLALENLEGLRNENTNEDAIESLKSILNLMKASTIFWKNKKSNSVTFHLFTVHTEVKKLSTWTLEDRAWDQSQVLPFKFILPDLLHWRTNLS